MSIVAAWATRSEPGRWCLAGAQAFGLHRSRLPLRATSFAPSFSKPLGTHRIHERPQDMASTDPPIRGWYSRGSLPHFDVPGVPQLITFRQDDSVPAKLARAYGLTISRAKQIGERARAQDRVLSHMEKYLGKGRGSCRLADPRAAEIVERVLLEGQGRDYELIAWVVMPNHVHVIV